MTDTLVFPGASKEIRLMWRKSAVGLFMFCGCVVGLAAEAPDPALSTPRFGAISFVKAMESNNLDTFRSVTIGQDADYKLFEPLVNMVGAAKQLEKAARDRFGKAGRAVVRVSPAVGLEVQVQESEVRINGDTAIVFQKGQEQSDPLTLRKTAAGWKVDLTAIRNREKMADAADGMRKMQKVLTEAAEQIRAGQFQTAEEAEAAIERRMQQAASEKSAPAK
jgi:hypothetical protein